MSDNYVEAPEAPVHYSNEEAQAWQAGWEAHANAKPERETFPAPVEWNHIALPEGTVMIRRYDVEVGDRVVSSHYGKSRPRVVEVIKGEEFVPGHHVEIRFEGHGERSDNGTRDGYVHSRNERYDGDSLIPLLPKGV